MVLRAQRAREEHNGYAAAVLFYKFYGVSIWTCQMQASVSTNCSQMSPALFVIL